MILSFLIVEKNLFKNYSILLTFVLVYCQLCSIFQGWVHIILYDSKVVFDELLKMVCSFEFQMQGALLLPKTVPQWSITAIFDMPFKNTYFRRIILLSNFVEHETGYCIMIAGYYFFGSGHEIVHLFILMYKCVMYCYLSRILWYIPSQNWPFL